jgi:Tfp pilus assembly protein PilN
LIRINLLPLEYQIQRKGFDLPDRVTMVIYGSIILLILACGVSFFSQSHALVELQLRRDLALQEEKRLAIQAKTIERLEMRTAMLSGRMQVLRNLQGQRLDNVAWLNSVNLVLPGRLWILQAARNLTGTHTTIEGVSQGYRPIAELMQSMEDTGNFTAVQLMEAKREAGVKSAPIHFEVSAVWAVGIGAGPVGVGGAVGARGGGR